MNKECEAVKTTLWAEAPTVGWLPSLHSEIFNMRRRCAPSSHVSNERTQNPMAGKIQDDWWVRPSHGEASGLREPRFWIRVFLLLDRLPAKANEPCLPTLVIISVLLSISIVSWVLMVQKICLSHLSDHKSELWQNSWLDPDAIWGGERSWSSDGCIRWGWWSSKEMGSFGVNLGRPIVTIGAFATPSSQITLRTCHTYQTACSSTTNQWHSLCTKLLVGVQVLY